jgi:subtilase family serine protease
MLLSNSWWWSPDDPATDEPYFEEMATQGQTFFSISGDYGAYTGVNYDEMGYPAEDVHLTVVGGTTLTTASAVPVTLRIRSVVSQTSGNSLKG